MGVYDYCGNGQAPVRHLSQWWNLTFHARDYKTCVLWWMCTSMMRFFKCPSDTCHNDEISPSPLGITKLMRSDGCAQLWWDLSSVRQRSVTTTKCHLQYQGFQCLWVSEGMVTPVKRLSKIGHGDRTPPSVQVWQHLSSACQSLVMMTKPPLACRGLQHLWVSASTAACVKHLSERLDTTKPLFHAEDCRICRSTKVGWGDDTA